MGLFSRLFVPRGVRRAMHPAQALKSALTPRSVKKARRVLHPVRTTKYRLERKVARRIRSGGRRRRR